MIEAFYNIEYAKHLDKSKSYYSRYYNYCLIKPIKGFNYYNIATNINKSSNKYIYLILYKENVDKSIKLKYSTKGWWKINFGHHIPHRNFDYNINLEFVESRDNPISHIYKVSFV